MGVSLASYRESTGGEVLTTSPAVASFDTQYREDPAFSESGGEVEIGPAMVVWARWSSKYELASGAMDERQIATQLQHKPSAGSFADVPAAHGFARIPDGLNGIRRHGVYLGALIECGAGDELRARRNLLSVTTPGNTKESADSSSLELLEIPASFPVFLAELSTQVSGLAGSWTTIATNWNATRTDAGFSFNSTTGELTVDNTGRHIFVGNFTFTLDTVEPASTNGQTVQVRLRKNGGAFADSMGRAYLSDFPTGGLVSFASICVEIPFDATAGDEITIEARSVFRDGSSTAKMVALESGFGVFYDDSGAGYFRSEFDPAQDADVSSYIEWDKELEDGSGFAHLDAEPEKLNLSEGDFWLGVNIASDRSGGVDLDWLGHRGEWWLGEPTPAVITGRGLGHHTNKGWGPDSRKQDLGSLCAGIFLEIPSGGETIRFRATKTTSETTASTFVAQPGVNAVGSLFWGIELDAWPTGAQQVDKAALAIDPKAIAARQTAQAPTGPTVALDAKAVGAAQVSPAPSISLDVAAHGAKSRQTAQASPAGLEFDAKPVGSSSICPAARQSLSVSARGLTVPARLHQTERASLGLGALELGVSQSASLTPAALAFAAKELGAHSKAQAARQSLLLRALGLSIPPGRNQAARAGLTFSAHGLRIPIVRPLFDLSAPVATLLAPNVGAPPAVLELARSFPLPLLDLS